jgi:hypothetical protein
MNDGEASILHSTCTSPGFGVRASAGADHWAGGVAEGVGEERPLELKYEVIFMYSKALH